MYKNIKLVAALSTTAILALGASFSSFAATGWQYNGSNWKYYDRENNTVTEQWKKSGDQWYYLNSDGKMAVDELIEDGDNYYYVDSNGKMAQNEWRYLEDEEGDFAWYYFQNNGKAKDDGFLTLSKNKYHFTDSKMDEGWLQDDGDTYYLNKENGSTEGTVKTGWVYIDDFDDDDSANANEEGWYYFGTNGKMVVDQEKKINGTYYVFDENGLMLENWVEFSKSTATNSIATDSNVSKDSIYKYFTETAGNRIDGWSYLDDLGEDEGRVTEEGWYYFQKGIPYSASYKTTQIADGYGVAKIKGEVYCFDESGKMVTGKIETNNGTWFYFDENDGAMKHGKVKITDSDDLDDGTYYFNNSGSLGVKGESKTGVIKGYLYDNGELVEAEDGTKYEKVTVDGKDYMVNESGKVKTSGTVKDGDDVKWKITKDSYGDYLITEE
jgi:glucan-binding YG repeat protein